MAKGKETRIPALTDERSIKEALDVRLGRKGDPLDRALTMRDMIDSGMPIKAVRRTGQNAFYVEYEQPVSRIVPPSPQGFIAQSQFGGVNLLWDQPPRAWEISHTEIFRGTQAYVGSRIYLTAVGGTMHFDAIDAQADTLYYYWIRFVSITGHWGPYVGPLSAAVIPLVSDTLERLTGEIDDSHLAQSLSDEIALISGAGSGSVDARVQAETDARIADVQDEAQSRIAAILAEQDARAAAISSEQSARQDGDSALAVRVDELSVKIDSLPVFSSGFEDGNDFAQWSASAGHTLAQDNDAFIGVSAALITSTATAPLSSGVPEGVVASVAEGTAAAFAGKRIRVRLSAKQPAAGASAEFAVAYSTNDGADSGWQRFVPGATWTTVEFFFDVPADGTATDYVALWADTSGSGLGVLIDAVSIEATTSEIPEFTAAIQTEQQARKDGDDVLASQITALEASTGDNLAAAVTQAQQARASLQQALAEDITLLSARTGDNESQISTLQQARSDDDAATALRDSLIAVQSAAGRAMVRTEEVSRVEEDAALASQITTVQASLGDDVATVQTSLQTNVERIDGELVALGAQYTAQVNVNGLIGGFGVYNDGTTVDAGFDVDRFWVGRTSTDKRKPFIIQDGLTYIDEAMIREASIQAGQIGAVTVGKLTRDDGSPVTTVSGLLRADAIDADNLNVNSAARFSGDVYSDNFQSGSAGWALLQNGYAEFNEAMIRGNLEVQSITVNGQSPFGAIQVTKGDVHDSAESREGWTGAQSFYGVVDGTDYISEMPKGSKISLTIYPRIAGGYYYKGAHSTTSTRAGTGDSGSFTYTTVYYGGGSLHIHMRVRILVDGATVLDKRETFVNTSFDRTSGSSSYRASRYDSGYNISYTYPGYRSSSAVRAIVQVWGSFNTWGDIYTNAGGNSKITGSNTLVGDVFRLG